MKGPDLDSLREILARLDIRPLFQVVGGDHLFGIARHGSEVLVRSAHLAVLEAALGTGRHAVAIDLEIQERGIPVRLVSESIERIADRVREGDGKLLEELHSPLVVTGHAELLELREIARGYLTRGLTRYYDELARDALRHLETVKTNSVRTFLLAFRALLAGIHALEEGSVQPDLGLLAEAADLPFVKELLSRARRCVPLGDPARFEFLMGEARALRERLATAGERTELPEEAPDPGRLQDLVNRLRSG